MEDPNVYDQLVVVPKLAEQLACDHSFIYEIGLDELSHDEKIQKLSLVIGFVFAMYNTAQSIFKNIEYPTLDDKFIELIWSRIHLMPEIFQNRPDTLNYARECYNEVKRKSYEAGLKWSERALYDQFFQVCVRVFLEEMKLDRPDLHTTMSELQETLALSIMATTFKGVFSELKWELNESGDNSDSWAELKTFPHGNLTETEETIIRLYYYEGMTIKEIAAILDLSESRVSQMYSSLVKCLKTELKEKMKISKSKIISMEDKLDSELTGEEHLQNLDKRTDKIIIEHPFFDDYIKAFQEGAVKQVDAQNRKRLKKLNCSLFSPLYVSQRWKGWQIGIPRPPELFPKEWLELRAKDIEIFLRDFFKRVEKGELYCDYASVVDSFGEKEVKRRMAGKTGLHYSLERAYWTLSVKLRNWIRHNIETYNCSLVCELDEIVAKSDSWLRAAFFPMPGPFDIGPRKRKEFQKQMLGVFAPHLEEPLIEQIWA